MPLHHGAHQRQSLRGDLESQGRKARREACDPQYPHRVLDERRRDMTQHSGLEVAPAAEGIDQRTVCRLSNGIDGQIAACQIFLEGDFGTEVDGESAITGCHLALEPRQCMFFLSVGMQKHRKVAPDFAVIPAQQLLARPTDDDPVSFLDGQSQQGVPNRSANQIHLHA